MMRGGSGAFPVVEERDVSVSSGTTSHSVSVSAGGAVAGELLVAAIALNNADGVTWPAGWTELFDTPVSTTVGLSTGYRVATGGETSVTVTSATSGNSVHRAWRVSGAGTAPEAGTATTGTSTAPDPPSLTPSWGATGTLWIAVAATLETPEFTAFPSGYSQTFQASNTARLGAAELEQNASSEDPGAFTLDASEDWIANTVAVEPA